MVSMNKGHTVHLDIGGRTACGVTPKRFLGKPAVSKNIRYVTCRACEAQARPQAVILDRGGPEEPLR